MTLLCPKAIIDNGAILTEMAIVFDEKIIEIAPLPTILQHYDHLVPNPIADNTILIPGLINAHVHLEFSANKNTLRYGEFLPWLYSVMEYRDTLINECTHQMITEQLRTMLASGTTTIGAISSYALDLQACEEAQQNIIFFNELIGSQPQMVDALYEDFLSRLESSKAVIRPGFSAGIALHSPYSVHPILAKKALALAQEEHLALSAHFLESPSELAWLEDAAGDFQPFFKSLLQQSKPQHSSDSFLETLNSSPTLLTHATMLQLAHLKKIQQAHHTVVHCPTSNRLLGNGRLNIDALHEHHIPWAIATDGLSSNTSLSLLDEMRNALFMHYEQPLDQLATALLQAATSIPANALGLNKGRVAKGFDADLALFHYEGEINEQLALHLILHEKMAVEVYIRGVATLHHQER